MVRSLVLIVVAALSAGAVAYGTDAGWMQYPHGLQVILWARRLQWPLVCISLVACILLIALAISHRRRAWWLVGLAPVLALFAHRFALGSPAAQMIAVENPAFIAGYDAKLADEEWVVGLSFGDDHFAFPYSALFNNPVVIQADHDKRLLLVWSAYANRALAVQIEHDLRARDLDIVSTPADALLLYNSRTGQFINGLTGQTMRHDKPSGFTGGLPIPTEKLPWKDWRAAHPDTKVLARATSSPKNAPTQPIQPAWPIPAMKLDRPAQTLVALVGNTDPLAVESNRLTAAPLNAKADGVPIAIFREQSDAPIRAFDRRTYDRQGKLDLIVNLLPNLNHKRHPQATFVDVGSNSGWNADGICVDAPTDAKYIKGRHLEPVGVDDNLPWGVVKFWYPALELEIPPAAPIAVDRADETTETGTPGTIHHRPHKPRPAQ